jgi:Domain of unknown function (DUF3825)
MSTAVTLTLQPQRIQHSLKALPLRSDYKSLTRRYFGQPGFTVFAHFGYGPNATWEAPYEKLAGMAKPEAWNFTGAQGKQPGQRFPILVNYLNFTFLRLQDLRRITYSTDRKRVYFNTGLQTPNEPDIFRFFAFHACERETTNRLDVGRLLRLLLRRTWPRSTSPQFRDLYR